MSNNSYNTDAQLLNELQYRIIKNKKVPRILSICSNCKKIQNTKNTWYKIEDYFKEYLAISFTHSTCPECKEELYPDIIFESSIKPTIKYTENGNIFNILGIAYESLKNNDMDDQAKEMLDRVMKANSHYEVSNIISEYVEVE